MEWLEQNKEWFLSGAGISLFLFLSNILTWWFTSSSEKKKIKKLSIFKNIGKISIPILNDTNHIASEHIKVSYKGNEYENLCMCNIQLRNISDLAIENQTLHIVIPENSKIVAVFERKSIDSIKIDKENKLNPGNKEIIYKIKRLEADDTYIISYLLDIEDVTLIKIEPRGVDNIKYIYKGDISESKIENALIFIAMFIVLDAVPVFGSFIQSMMILISIPFMIDLIKKYKNFKLSKDNIFNINGNIEIDKDGELHIDKLTK